MDYCALTVAALPFHSHWSPLKVKTGVKRPTSSCPFPFRMVLSAVSTSVICSEPAQGFLPAQPLKSREEEEVKKWTLNPSTPYANIMRFRAGYNAQIFVGENEAEESVVRRFRREVSRAGVIQECRRRRSFESKQEINKRKSQAAARRNARRRIPTIPPKENEVKHEEEEEEDNWELPDRDVGF